MPKNDIEQDSDDTQIFRVLLAKLGTIDSTNAAEAVRLRGQINMFCQANFLLRWKKRQNSLAFPLLLEIIEHSRDASNIIQKFKLSFEDHAWFSFGRSALVSYLVHGNFEPAFIKRCRLTKVPEPVLKMHCNDVVDMNLAMSLAGEKKCRGYDAFLDKFYKNPRVRLARQTYFDYGRLIDAVSKSHRDQLPELIAACEANYLKRAADINYYNFPHYDGGCRYNELHLDFRLATILQWAYRDHPKEKRKLNSIHQWMWRSPEIV